MARKPRIDYPGAWHHVMNRGADHQVTFRTDDDRLLFLRIWAEAVSRFGVIVTAYCLMSNHYHLLVQSPTGQLSQALQFVGRSYTQQFNNRHGRDGALFRGRFHSVLIDSNTYFDRVARYIELNPVAAQLVSADQLARYRWSSFQYYAEAKPTPLWLSTAPLLDRFSSTKQYLRFVQSAMTDSELDNFYRRLGANSVLGEQAFLDRISSDIPGGYKANATRIPEVSIDALDAIVACHARCSEALLRTATPGQRNIVRSVALDVARLLTGYSLADLTGRYGISSRQAASNSLNRSRTKPSGEERALRAAVLQAMKRDSEGLPLA